MEKLRKDIEGLKGEIRRIWSRLSLGGDSPEVALKKRGFRLASSCPQAELIYPLVEGKVDEFYENMKRYSFRLFLRDIVKLGKGFRAGDLTHYCSPEAVSTFLESLLSAGIIKETGKGIYALFSPQLDNFGGTLEWFVAQVFQREFASPASWGIRLLETESGGDYDVIAQVEGRIVYVEVKSSPPKNIYQEMVGEFLTRTQELRPNLGIFLADTQLRLEDKINKLFKWELEKRGRGPVKMARLREGIFLLEKEVMVINGKPDLLANLAFCLRHFFGFLER